MLLAVSRVHESVPLFLVEGLKRRLGSLRGPQGRGARPRLQARHRRRARLALAQADPPARARAGRRRRPRPARADADAARSRRRSRGADAVVVATNHSEFREPGALARDRRARRGDCLVVDPWNALGAGAGVRATRPSWRALAPRPAVSRVLVTGGAGTIGAAVVRRLLGDPRLGGARLRPARAAAVDARGLRGPHRRPARPRRGARGAPTAARTSSTWPRSSAASPTSTSSRTRYSRSTTRLYNARLPRRARRTTSSASSTSRRSMVFERADASSRRPRSTLRTCPMPRSAYGFSKLTGEVYCRAAHDEHGLPYTICRPFNAYGPGEMPDDEPGIAHTVPDLIRKVLLRPARRCRSSARASRRARSPTSTTSPTASSPRWPRRTAVNEDFNISAAEELTVAEIARDHLGGVRAATRRRSSSSTCRRSRSTSAPLAVRREGRAAARLGGADRRRARGSAQTVEWLRGVVGEHV